jgi:hypothetical protein
MAKCPHQFVNIFAGFMENKLATSYFLEASIVIICNQGVVLDPCTDSSFIQDHLSKLMLLNGVYLLLVMNVSNIDPNYLHIFLSCKPIFASSSEFHSSDLWGTCNSSRCGIGLKAVRRFGYSTQPLFSDVSGNNSQAKETVRNMVFWFPPDHGYWKRHSISLKIKADSKIHSTLWSIHIRIIVLFFWSPIFYPKYS